MVRARREALVASRPKVIAARVSEPVPMNKARTTWVNRMPIAAAVAISTLLGCGANPPMTVIPFDGPPVTQRSSGASIYGETCASCHGEHGEGLEGKPA